MIFLCKKLKGIKVIHRFQTKTKWEYCMKKTIDILSLFNKEADISQRQFSVGGIKINAYYINCLVDGKLVASGVFDAINKLAQKEQKMSSQKVFKLLQSQVISASDLKVITSPPEIQENIFNGGIVLVVNGQSDMLAINVAGFVKRAIAEPPTSSVVRGPREGFIEDLEVNLSMVRRRLKTPSLAVKRLTVGKRTKTRIALCYLNGVVNPIVVQKIEEKLNSLDIDGILDSYYIEECLSQDNDKFFKRLGNSEKPDVVTAKVLEGRVAILVDGSPVVLTAPFILFEDMQSPGDYYDIPGRTSYVRFVRLIGLMFAILLPGLYVALQSYHYKILPINFLISLLSSIEGLSFPPILEILFVLFLFEILNEASVRMPKQLGMALSIIGALILGDTAVQAGIITPPSIVVVAISGITLYIIPNEASEASLLRTLFTVIGGVAGFYGMFLSFLVLSTYLASINSYNTPYMAPYGPSIATDKKDGFIKQPLKEMIYRPKSFKTYDSVRLQPSCKKIVVKQSQKNCLKEGEKRCR